MRRLLRKFLGKFVKSRIISSATDFTEVPYAASENQLSDNIVAVGPSTRSYLFDNRDDIPPSTVSKFFV